MGRYMLAVAVFIGSFIPVWFLTFFVFNLVRVLLGLEQIIATIGSIGVSLVVSIYLVRHALKNFK